MNGYPGGGGRELGEGKGGGRKEETRGRTWSKEKEGDEGKGEGRRGDRGARSQGKLPGAQW